MGTIRRRGDSWRAEVHRQGVRQSRTFSVRQQAVDWIAGIESDILDGKVTRASAYSLADLCERYDVAVSSHRRDPRSERIRLNRIARGPLGDKPVPSITPAVIAEWRDERGKTVQPGTVLRELSMIRSLLEYARRDLGWIVTNPVRDVRKPAVPPPRTRVIADDERDLLIAELGYTGKVETVSQEVAVALLIALETAMRAGEIVGLRWQDVDLVKRVAHLPMTKNGRARDVPLIGQSVALLKVMRGRKLIRLRVRPDPSKVFHIDTARLDTLFRRAKLKVGLNDIHFHDSRATALTRLSRLVDVLTLAKISGHRDVKVLANVYYRETAEQIAARLD